MRNGLGWMAVALAALALGGCVAPLATAYPYPAYGNPVNPTPAPGYRVRCTSVLLPGAPAFVVATTGCRQELFETVHERVVVRARG